MTITTQELADAKVDVDHLEEVVNGLSTAGPGNDGLLLSRLGEQHKTLSRILEDLATQDIGASAAALINARLDEIETQLHIVRSALFEPLYPQWVDPTNNYLLETGGFSGWSTVLGSNLPPFTGVRFKTRPFGGGNPTNAIVTIRAGSQTGTIFGETTIPYALDGNGYLVALFPSQINNSGTLVFQFQANDKSSFFGRSVPGNPAYWQSNGDQDHTWASSSTDYIQEVELGIENINQGGATGSYTPKLFLPSTIWANYQETTQLFLKGMLLTLSDATYDVTFEGADINTSSTPGRDYKRYYEFTPGHTQTEPLTIKVNDQSGNELVTATTNVVVSNPNTSPASLKRVLCVGDSLTSANVWVSEMQRRLTGNGPAVISGYSDPGTKSFNNIEFIGTQNSGGSHASHEGYAGRHWSWFMNDAASPFTSGTTFNFSNYMTTNGYPTVDHIYTLLTWNAWPSGLRQNVSDWADVDLLVRQFIDHIRAAFPACRFTLMGLQCPSEQGLADDFGDASVKLGNYWCVRQTQFSYNEMLQDVANRPAYSSFVDYLGTAAHFDTENEMPSELKPVNSRNQLTERVQNNGVHPSAGGYYQIADMAYRHFGALYCV